MLHSPAGEKLAGRLLAACILARRDGCTACTDTPIAASVAGCDLVIDLSGRYEARPGQEVWRLQAGSGRLDGPFALSASWHRSPFWLPVSLKRVAGHAVHTLSSSDFARSDLLGIAHIGSTGRFRDLQAKVAETASLLVRRALEGNAAIEVTEPVVQAQGRDGLLALAQGWLHWQAARWRSRLFVEWWTVGICDRSIQAVLASGSLGAVTWLRPRPGAAFWADPFPVPDSRDLLAEECAVAGGPGVIALLRQTDAGEWRRDRILLGGRMHRSYPSTFSEFGQSYLVSECLGAGEVLLYRFDGLGRTEVVATIASVPLADPTLFRHTGRYWVAATDVTVGLHDNLCLFHAERLTGPWRPHPGNPVKIDIRSSRPAGTPFEHQGRLFRPAQDCAGAYGKAVVINEVLELTVENFAERPTLRLAADPEGLMPDGLHTLSAAGAQTLVDGRRMVPSPGSALRRAAKRLRAIGRHRR